MGEELSVVLWKLSQGILDIVKRLKENQSIHKVKRLYVRFRLTQFEYKEGGGISSQGSNEYLEKEEWDWRDYFRIIDSEIKGLPIYSETFKSISDIYGVNVAQAEFWLSQFAQNILGKAVNEETSEENVLDSITTFLNDLNGNPLMWHVTVELEGVWMGTEEAEVSKGIRIRKPQSGDFEFDRPFEYISLPPRGPPFGHPMAIMEVMQRVKIQLAVWDDLEKLIISLRLYKIGSVNKLKTMWKPKSILDFGGTSWSNITQPIVYKYSLTYEDAQKLQSFIGKMKPLLSIVQGKIEATDYVSIALQRYNDSLFKSDATERITYAIMGLEALFLKPQEREELLHKLSQRVSRCLSIFGHQSLEVYRVVRDAYNARSQFIHGALVEEEKRRDGIIVSDGIVWTVLVGTLNSALGDTLKCFKNSSKSAKTEEQMHHAL